MWEPCGVYRSRNDDLAVVKAAHNKGQHAYTRITHTYSRVLNKKNIFYMYKCNSSWLKYSAIIKHNVTVPLYITPAKVLKAMQYFLWYGKMDVDIINIVNCVKLFSEADNSLKA